MPRVFIPQIKSRFDAATRLWIPTINTRPAERHGELVVMLPPNANQLHTAPLVQVIKERMADVGPDDYIMAVGDPSLIGAASAIMVRNTGLLRMLKWDRMTSDYVAVEVKV